MGKVMETVKGQKMKPYYEMRAQSVIADAVMDYALSPDITWGKYYNFDAIQIPNSILSQDPTILDISTRHPLMGGVVRLPPNTFYNWHKDTRRGVSINMVLNPQDGLSHCMFTTDKEVVVGEFTELKYKANTYYVFNTQENHIVFNFNSPRYLLTIEFGEDKNELGFTDLVEEIL